MLIHLTLLNSMSTTLFLSVLLLRKTRPTLLPMTLLPILLLARLSANLLFCDDS
jgi:hypothetical protein